MSGEQVISDGSEFAGNVALTIFAGSWAAAWRAGDQGLESVRVRVGASIWTTESFPPAVEGDHPALVELDETHLLLFFSVGEGAFDAGPSGGRRLRVAVIDVDAPGVIQSREFVPLTPPFDANVSLRQSRPAAARAGDRIFVAWQTESPLADPLQSEAFLTEIGWSPSTPGVVELAREWPLTYDATRVRDQTSPAIAGAPLFPEGALIGVWDDYSRTPVNPPSPDLLLVFRPIPFVSLNLDAGGVRFWSSTPSGDVFR